MILYNILAFFIGFGIVILLYNVFDHYWAEYLWRKAKHHVIEAIEALDLWDVVNTPGSFNQDVFNAITTFLEDHEYKHCFTEQGGAFWLMVMLFEIRNEHERA